ERNSTMKTLAKTDERGLNAALWAVAIVGVVLALASPVLFGKGAALSVALGAGLAFGNLWLLARLVRAFLSGGGAQLSWLVISLIKFGALLLAVAWLVRAGYARALPLMLGFAALPLGIVAAQLRGASGQSEG